MKRFALCVAILLCASTASARGSVRGYQRSNVSAGFGSGGGWQGFSPSWIPGLVVWLQPSVGLTLAASPVTAAGTTPPTVTLSGTPVGPQTSAATPFVELDCTTLGILGTSKYTLKLNGATVATNVASASSGVSIPGSGLTAGWAAGTSAVNDVYTANSVVSTWADQSGHGNNFTQATSANRPIAASVCLAGTPCMSVAVGQSLSGINAVSATVNTSTAERLFVAKNATDPPSGGSTGANETNWGTSGSASATPFTDATIYDGFATNVRKGGFSHSDNMAIPYVYDSYSKANDWEAWLNGKSIFTTGTNTFSVPITVPIILGTNIAATFGTYVVYNTVLASSDRTRLVHWLGAQYGVSVP